MVSPEIDKGIFYAGPLIRAEYSTRPERNAASTAYNSALRGWLLSVMVEEVARFREESLQDRLTKVLNREGLAEKYQDIKTRGSSGSILFIDIDGFKSVNDGPGGHLLGDDTLLGVAGILRSIREDDPVARIGGDEFVVLMEGADEQVSVTRGKTICQLIKAISSVNGQPVNIGASVGVAIFEQDTPWEEAYSRGDSAMYLAKNNGGNQVVAFSEMPKN